MNAAMNAASKWWQANRIGLAALPFVLAALVFATVTHARVVYGFAPEWERPVAVASGDQGTLTVVDDDIFSGTSTTFDVSARLVTVGYYPTTVDRPDVPAGSTAAVINLELAADPSALLVGCRMAVVGTDGHRYSPQFTTDITDVEQSICVPEATPGPTYSGDLPTRPRPSSWRVETVVVMPAGTEVARVWLGWDGPDYLDFTNG